MALSKNFRVCDSFARAEQFCQDVELVKVPAGGLLAMFKRRILSVTTFAGGALNIFYQVTNKVPMALAGSNGLYTADVSALSFFRISAVTVPLAELSGLSAGDDGVYYPIASLEGFHRVIKNVERASSSRNYYLELGADTQTVHMFVPIAYTQGKTEVAITTKRTPDISFTLDDARDPASQLYMDLPDFYVNYVESAAAIDALKQAGIKENQMQGLMDEHKEVLTALNQLYKAEEQDLKNRGADQ